MKLMQVGAWSEVETGVVLTREGSDWRRWRLSTMAQVSVMRAYEEDH